MEKPRVAVVTGSNKGIGLAIVRALCKQFDGDVYLTSRDVGRGQEAVKELEKEPGNLKPKFHQLDVCDKSSIERLKDYIVEHYGGLDILVNNAGIAFKSTDTTPFAEQVDVTLKTNYYALQDVCEAMFPILRSHARVVHVSSFTSFFAIKSLSEARKQQILAAKTVDDVNKMMREFAQHAKEGKHKENGWAESGYATGKLALTAITPIQQQIMDKNRPGDDIVINSMCPGFVATDMTKAYKGGVTPDEGADSAVYAALLPAGEKNIRGCFIQRRKVYDWKNGEYAGVPK